MRIAMLSWESMDSIAVGGLAAHITGLSRALAVMGHEVHLFTRIGPRQSHHEVIQGVHIHRCTHVPHEEFVDDVNNMCRAFVERFFLVEDFQGPFDIVHCHDWLAGNAMIWIKQGRARPSLLTIHSTEYGRCGNCFNPGVSERIRYQERAATYWADHVVAVSEVTRKEVQWLYEVPAQKSSAIHNGVDGVPFLGSVDVGAARSECGLGPKDQVIFFCGRMVWQKGPDLLVDAVADVLASFPRARFVFAGDGLLRAGLEKRCKQMGLEWAVRFLGYKSTDDLVRYYKMSDMVVVPSRNEPFGIVVLEAWCASKPVVVTQQGGPNEFVNHEVDGLKIYPTAHSVAWGLKRLLADPELGRRMGEAGHSAIQQRFTWEVVGQRTLETYQRIMPKPQVPTRTGQSTAPAQPPVQAPVQVPVKVPGQVPGQSAPPAATIPAALPNPPQTARKPARRSGPLRAPQVAKPL